jgi:hypothetical protein
MKLCQITLKSCEERASQKGRREAGGREKRRVHPKTNFLF